jgi:hypothetical protein
MLTNRTSFTHFAKQLATHRVDILGSLMSDIYNTG